MLGYNELLANVRGTAAAIAAQRLHAKVGYVTSFNPKTHAVKVRLEPESTSNERAQLKNPVVETHWLPVMRTFGGNGWGMIAPPNANPQPPYGDMAIVLWPDGGHGVALVGFFNDVERAFTGPAAGEWWLTHKDGAFIKVKNDGSILIHDKLGNAVDVDSANDRILIQHHSGSFVNQSGGSVTIQSSGGGMITITGANVQIN